MGGVRSGLGCLGRRRVVTPSAVIFSSPGEVKIQQDPALTPQGDQVLVKTRFSAISAGTELMIYRGEVPENTPLDLPALSGMMEFPLRYGYSAVGEVVALGDTASSELEGTAVFAFQPHASHFLARASELLPLPEGLSLESALFLPNMETAVNFLHDGAPRVGERVVVFGQGVVGLLTAALLARIPLDSLVTVDHHSLRRATSLELGAHHALEPGELLSSATVDRADLSYELSGAPAALSEALDVTGFGGRIVLGSWYGTRPVALDLGGRFHRNRIKLIGSQVSTLAPELTGRWDKRRRMRTAMGLIQEIHPERWITHRFPLESAADAYSLLANHPEHTLQVILTYESES